MTLAIAQLLVQLFCFLHLGQESKPRWNLVALVFALFIVVVLVGGTLWIMHNLGHGQMQNASDIFTEENIFPHAP
jgi:cytochrome o ubiquinol oxidase operon protein cyoD